MKLAIVTAYPPSKVTLNEYAYHLVKHFRQQADVSELIILTDITPEEADVNFYRRRMHGYCKTMLEI